MQYLIFENRSIYEIVWKNVVEPGRPQMIILSMRIICWVTKATSTLSECVMLIAFQRQRWLRERLSMLRYTILSGLLNI